MHSAVGNWGRAARRWQRRRCTTAGRDHHILLRRVLCRRNEASRAPPGSARLPTERKYWPMAVRLATHLALFGGDIRSEALGIATPPRERAFPSAREHEGRRLRGYANSTVTRSTN
jgi:hypothetical protein